jgi:hypothetical protein
LAPLPLCHCRVAEAHRVTRVGARPRGRGGIQSRSTAASRCGHSRCPTSQRACPEMLATRRSAPDRSPLSVGSRLADSPRQRCAGDLRQHPQLRRTRAIPQPRNAPAPVHRHRGRARSGFVLPRYAQRFRLSGTSMLKRLTCRVFLDGPRRSRTSARGFEDLETIPPNGEHALTRARRLLAREYSATPSRRLPTQPEPWVTGPGTTRPTRRGHDPSPRVQPAARPRAHPDPHPPCKREVPPSRKLARCCLA